MVTGKPNIEIDRVIKRIEALIFTGELQPNERLVIKDLANRLAVSKYWIRNALKALEAKGLVVNIPHKGAMVSNLTEEEVEEIFVVRVGLERMAGRLAYENITERNLVRLDKINSRIKKYFSDNKIGEMIAGNQEFHNYLTELSGNRILTQMIAELKVRFHILNTTAWSSPEAVKRLVAEHDEYIKALRTGDLKLLDDLPEKHLGHAKTMFINNLRTKRAIVV